MATTVNNAFAQFMKDTLNLDADKTKLARTSRDNLIENIKGFSGDDDFFRCMRIKFYVLVPLNVVQKLGQLMILILCCVFQERRKERTLKWEVSFISMVVKLILITVY